MVMESYIGNSPTFSSRMNRSFICHLGITGFCDLPLATNCLFFFNHQGSETSQFVDGPKDNDAQNSRSWTSSSIHCAN